MRRRAVVGFCSLLVLSGCGSSSSSPPGEPVEDSAPADVPAEEVLPLDGDDKEGGFDITTLEIDPPNATLFIDTGATPPTAATLAYKVRRVGSDGTFADVTADATLSIDDAALGSFAGSTFTSTTTLPAGKLGVTTTVRAVAFGKETAAALTIVALRKSGASRDFYFVEPYLAPPSPDRDVLKFGTSIKQVDVAVTMDTTASMAGAVANLKANVSTLIFPELVKAIPSVGMSVSHFDDYPVDLHGIKACPQAKVLPGDVPHATLQTITTDLLTAQAAANKLELHCGGDVPESQIPSMLHILTGAELKWTGGTVTPHTPAAGTFGGVDFRPGSVPVVVLITDADWHDPTSTSAARKYKSNVLEPPSYAKLAGEFKKASARFVNVTSGPQDQADELADDSGSYVAPSAFGGKCGAGKCCTGEDGAAELPTGPGGTCRLNFRHLGGKGVSDGIVAAIRAISVGTQFDVTALASNDPSNPDGVDATKFIESLRAMEEGNPAAGCPPMTGKVKDRSGDGVPETFIGLVVGTPVCFEILPKMNDFVAPKETAQFFNAFIDVIGLPGSIKLDRRSVLFLVPPKTPGPAK
ncbi:MAG: hypothetical protein HYV09_07130 [Deltaproteobacteria bacterium]|nr:hypothetical protein [Deltaproteobacteria bacterium]